MTRIAFVLSLAACAHATDPDAFTLAVASDTDVMALTFDGHDACVFHEGQLESCFQADSAAAAVWGWYEPDGEAFNRSASFAGVLTRDEIAGIEVADLSL